MTIKDVRRIGTDLKSTVSKIEQCASTGFGRKRRKMLNRIKRSLRSLNARIRRSGGAFFELGGKKLWITQAFTAFNKVRRGETLDAIRSIVRRIREDLQKFTHCCNRRLA